jgi:hypothetical protein
MIEGVSKNLKMNPGYISYANVIDEQWHKVHRDYKVSQVTGTFA